MVSLSACCVIISPGPGLEMFLLRSKACSGVLSLIKSLHNGIYMDTYTFDTCYFSVALLFKLCSAAQELVVQNNVRARDPPMYGNRTHSQCMKQWCKA